MVFNMRNAIIPLLLLILLPGCWPKNGPWYKSSSNNMPKARICGRARKIKTKVPAETPQEVPFDEELDSFILLDDIDEESSSNKGLEVGSYEDVYLDEDDDISFVDDRDISSYDFKTAYYDFDRSTIRPDQLPAFQHNLASIKKAVRDGKTIVIEGHADNAAGTRAYNLQLSQKRAQLAAAWFIEHGVPERSIKSIGRGSEMLIVPYGDKNEQAPNRRVEIYITSSPA